MYEQSVSFSVPAQRAGLVRDALEQVGHGCDETILTACYFDTPTYVLTRKHCFLRLRREDGQWIQTWLTPPSDCVTRVEHTVPVAAGRLDLARIAGREGTHLLGDGADSGDGQSPYRLQAKSVVERTRCVVVAGESDLRSTFELVLDRGQMRAGKRTAPITNLRFGLLSGALLPMLTLAGRWRQKFGLVYMPLSDAGRGARLAWKKRCEPLRRAGPVALSRKVSVALAAPLMFDECFAQVAHNCAALASGHGNDRHVHQCRVGIRRLRTVLKLLRGWTAALPAPELQGLADLHQALGKDRDPHVFRHQVLPKLYAAGCPPLGAQFDKPQYGSDAAASCLSAQDLMLRLLIWRHQRMGGPRAGEQLRPLVRRRLRNWLRDVQSRAGRFETLSESQRHALRNRIKRLRYACTVAADLLPASEVQRLRESVFSLQTCLGDWCDLQMSRRLLLAADGTNSDPAAVSAGLRWIARESDALALQMGDRVAVAACITVRL